MANRPKFLGPDNVLREDYIFSTDLPFRFFEGETDADTADMLVSIRGGAFEANPDYILFEGTSFIIPNPSAFPDGLQLLPGANRIEVKSVLTNGQITTSAVISANLSLDRDVKAGVTAPSGVSVERLDQSVRIDVTGLDDENVVGYNFYASTSPGGGLTGYKRINAKLVTSSTKEEVVEALAELTTDADVAVNLDGEPQANPLFMRVVGTQVDKAAALVQSDFDESVEVSETITQLRTTVTVEAVSTIDVFSFTHNRDAGPSDTPATLPYSEFNAIPDTDSLYYAVSAVYLIDGVEYESALSQEVVGSPITVTPEVASLPTVARQQIVQDATLSIYRARPEVDVKPGSYTRDTFIDPFSTEAERVRFVVGFLQACQSFTTLLAIDDPTNSGTSIPVSQSPYKGALKQAFFLRDDLSVQNLIDNCFDQLAANRGVVRKTGTRARGEVTFYRTTRPTSTQTLPIGTTVNGGVQCQTTSTARITPSGAGTYNPSTGRWSATAFVQATEVGRRGNLAPGSIRAVVGGPSGVQVVNENALFGGQDAETNRELALRADRALASVDSGTRQGYTKHASEVGGVLQVNVVEAGHPLMLRDLDVETGKHWGGKVDIWLRPENATRSIATLTDNFAFKFETVVDGQFEPVGDIRNLKFRAVNEDISEANPLIEMLQHADAGLEFQVQSGNSAPRTLDLTDVAILSSDTIQLSSTHNDPTSLNLTDIFTGCYRFRTSDRHVFRRQPVGRIVALYRNLDDGSQEMVSPEAYKLFHPEDPLGLGRSVEAGDYLKVIVPTDGTPPENIPSGTPVVVTGEAHTMLGGPEPLGKLGINKYMVRVFSLDRSVEYTGPFAPVGSNSDFTFVDEEDGRPLSIKLTDASTIVNGQEVLVDYEHDEEYMVEYETNSLVRVTQNAVDKTRHAAADVLAKEAVPVGVDIWATVVLLPNASPGAVGGSIRSELARLFGALSLGAPLRQGDVVDAIEDAPGVSYVVIPVTRLSRQDGSTIVREPLITTERANWTKISSWSTDAVQVYILNEQLDCGTENGGGDSNEFRGVFFDDIPMTLSDGLPLYDGAPLRGVAYSAAIIGNDGMTIPGFSGQTARRVLLALPEGTDPSDGKVTVTYIASDDTGVKNIEPGPAEYLVLGNLDITFGTDTDYTAVLAGARV